MAEGDRSAPRVEVRLLDRWVMTAPVHDVLAELDPTGALSRRASRAAAVSRAKTSVRGTSLTSLLRRPYDALRNLRRGKD